MGKLKFAELIVVIVSATMAAVKAVIKFVDYVAKNNNNTDGGD